MGGQRGHNSLRVARREIRQLKSLIEYLARHTATGTLNLAMIEGPAAWNVEKTLELVRVYLQLCQTEIKFGITAEESRRLEVLDADELRAGIEAQLSTEQELLAEDRTDEGHLAGEFDDEPA